jgi:hypothetical protein
LEFPSLPRTEHKQKLASHLLEESIVDSTFLNELENLAHRQRLKKMVKGAVENDTLSLGTFHDDDGKNYVVLPESFKQTGNYMGLAVIRLASKLGYSVYTIPRTSKLRNLTDSLEEEAIGVLLAVGDNDQPISVTEKKSAIERGRLFVRTQQIIGLFVSDKNLGLDALKRNHRYFGNNAGETEIINKKPVPVLYGVKDFQALFMEVDDAPFLMRIFTNLIKKSHKLLKDEIRESIVKNNILSYSEFVKIKCNMTVVLEPAQGRRLAKTKTIIPHKPKTSSCFFNR